MMQKLRLSSNAIAEILNNSPWFGDFTWNQLELLAHYVMCYQADEDATIFREGDNGDTLFWVISGKIVIHKENKQLSVIEKGRSFGEMSLIDMEPRSATAVAGTECCLVAIDRRGFNELTKDKSLVALKLIMKIATLLSQRLRQTSGLLCDHL